MGKFHSIIHVRNADTNLTRILFPLSVEKFHIFHENHFVLLYFSHVRARIWGTLLEKNWNLKDMVFLLLFLL